MRKELNTITKVDLNQLAASKMMLNGGRWLLLLAAVAVLLVLFAAPGVVESADEQVAKPEEPQPVAARQRFQLPKIFDFELYKRLFKKVYHGLEDTVRRKFMLARAFRAWISSLKYKYRTSSYYLALNHLSDRSPDELARMENHHDGPTAGANDAPELESGNNAPAQSTPEVDPNYIEQNLEMLTSGQMADFEDLKVLQEELKRSQQARRKKRHTDSTQRVRDFDLNKLISIDDGSILDPRSAEKVVWKPASNNPDYEAPEVTSFGIRTEELEPVAWFKANLPEKKPEQANSYSFFSDFSRSLSSALGEWRGNDGGESGQLPDEVFVDHRESGCMFLPRDQRNCGSCYAFAAIAIAEWLYCKRTGQLVAFSEQYLVDCGKPHLFYGCEGGHRLNVAEFIHNYGLELRVNYPYRSREDQCPYDDDTRPKSMGYIRMELGSSYKIPVPLLEKYIKLAPMYISISTKNGFLEYGGGVMDGAGCQPEGNHGVVLIGHGREDGREYWLIRNSHSVGWGERGHYKLAKDSECIVDYAVMYGPPDIKKFNINANRANDMMIVKSHYGKNLRKSLEENEI